MDTQVTHVEVVPAAGSAAAARPWLRRTLVGLLLIAAALGGGYRWWSNRPAALPAGITMSNGRLEATEVDVAARTAGRVKEVLAREGDVVAEGQLLARMDVATLEAAHRQALAQVAQAREAVATARAAVDERQSALAWDRLADGAEEVIAQPRIARAEGRWRLADRTEACVPIRESCHSATIPAA